MLQSQASSLTLSKCVSLRVAGPLAIGGVARAVYAFGEFVRAKLGARTIGHWETNFFREVAFSQADAKRRGRLALVPAIGLLHGAPLGCSVGRKEDSAVPLALGNGACSICREFLRR
jgi:hypothetical protein